MSFVERAPTTCQFKFNHGFKVQARLGPAGWTSSSNGTQANLKNRDVNFKPEYTGTDNSDSEYESRATDRPGPGERASLSRRRLSLSQRLGCN
jgi:hypothetical protein